jgi:hypothetical protein
MGLQDALRRAAGLLVELPTEGTTAEGSAPESAAPSSSANDEVFPEEKKPLDVDALLAEKGLGPKAAPGQKAGAAPKAPRTVEQIVRDSEGPNLDEIKMDAPPVTTPGAVIEPAAIYTAAKLPAAPFSAEQMLDMLASLPQELPLETRRQTVNVTLGALGKSMGATPETVVADASRKMAALAAYDEYLKKRTDEFAKTGEAEIEKLQAQIEEKRKAIFDARAQQQQTAQMCQNEGNRLHDVLEFFSLDVAPSKYATPDAEVHAAK